MNEFVVVIDGIKKLVKYEPGKIIIDDRAYECEILEKNAYSFLVRMNQKLYTITRVSEQHNPVDIIIEGHYFHPVVRTKLEQKAAEIAEKSQQVQHRSTVVSPMPGMVLKIKKQIGDNVELGESVLILEAMKMENDIKSPYTGTIKHIAVNEKQAVEKGSLLFSLE